MALTIPSPSNVRICYDTRAEFLSASVPALINYVQAGGLMYVRDATGTAATVADGSKWSPTPEHITPLHFGAAGDGATDDLAAIDAMLAWGATYGASVPWDSVTDDDEWPTQVVYHFESRTYAVSGPIDIEAANRNSVFESPSIIAIPGTWSTSGTEYIGDVKVTKDDYIFNQKASATYIIFRNPHLNCNGLCGGMKLRTRTIVEQPWIKKMGWTDKGTTDGLPEGSVGIYCASGDTHIRDGWIGQWDQSDPEYYDADAYSAVGLYAGDSDVTVIGTKFRWTHENIVCTGTNNRFVQIHSFNGMESYSHDGRSVDATLQAAMDAWFGFDTSAYDFPIRQYHSGVRVLPRRTDGATVKLGKNWDTTFDDCYFDNCHFELESDGTRFNNPKLGSKPSASLSYPGATYEGGAAVSPAGVIDYWWRCIAYETNGIPRVGIDGLEPYVESTVKQIIVFDGPTTWTATTAVAAGDYLKHLSGGTTRVYKVLKAGTTGGTGPNHTSGVATNGSAKLLYRDDADANWATGASAWETLDLNKMNETYGDNFRGLRGYTHLNVRKGTPATLYYTLGQTSNVQFADDNTTRSGTEIAGLVKFGSAGDHARVRASLGSLVVANTLGDLFGGEPNSVVIVTGDSGVTGVGANEDDLIIENNGHAGLSIAVPDNKKAGVGFYTATGGRVAGIEYDDATDTLTITSAARIKLAGVPTSSAGLTAGMIWSDAGTLKIV